MSEAGHQIPGEPASTAGMDAAVGGLVRAAQAGDTLAMNDLLDRLAPFVGRICGPIALAEAEDATQEALIVVFRSLNGLRAPEALYGWVRTIAVREALRVARSQRGRLTGELPEVPDPGQPLLGVAIRDTLTGLAPEHRAILVLRDVEGLSEQEASQLLAIKPGTVKSRLNRAQASFRRRWGA